MVELVESVRSKRKRMLVVDVKVSSGYDFPFTAQLSPEMVRHSYRLIV